MFSRNLLPPLLLSLTSASIAHTFFLPKNAVKIYPNTKRESGLSQESFNQIVDKIEKIYSPIVTGQGGTLVINRLWNDPTVNAGTYRDETQRIWYVNLYGGFARHPSITQDGMGLVLCHEIGHHLGGAPKKDPNYGNPFWSSTEGQSDYFATLKCLRRVFKEIPARAGDIPQIVQENCEKAHRNFQDAQLCSRMTMAGLSVANVMSETLNLPRASLYARDTSEAPMTFDHHPSPQCRLDTYFQGALCPIDYRKDLSQVDPKIGACTQISRPGTRPLCWYRP